MTNPEAEQPTNDNEALDFGKKKKKPKVKSQAEQEQSTSQTAAADKENVTEAGGIEDFGKKRRKPRVKFIEDQPEVVEVDDSNQDPNKMNEDQMLAESDSGSVWQGSERDYTYDELLTRVLNIMRDKNPDFEKDEKSKFVINPPQLSRIGTRKTSFTNFAEICSLLHRQEKHLLNFLLIELGTTGTLDKQKQLTIKGRFQQNQIQNVLRRYIKDYVMCQTCRSPETNIVKEDRLFYLKCKTCGATCSVASIKSGYQAQVGKRAAIRAKAT